MAKKIIAGSLVSTKRRVGGPGILDRIQDMNLYAEFDLSDAFMKNIYDIDHQSMDPAISMLVIV